MFSYFTNYVHLGNKNENKRKTFVSTIFCFVFNFQLIQFFNDWGKTSDMLRSPSTCLQKQIIQFSQNY